MHYDALLNLATKIGFLLQESGAEIYRVEESVQRVLAAYGVTSGEVFAIPNCLIVSLLTPQGQSLTRVRRQPGHGTDIYRLELLNAFCRRLCREAPPLEQAEDALHAICADRTNWPFGVRLLAYGLGTAFFSLLFGGMAQDALCSGLCGLCIGLLLRCMDLLHTNFFFRTTVCGFCSALLALFLVSSGAGQNADLIIIGGLMALVPGIPFTNAIRDMIAGDLVSGITKTVESLLVGVAIALGTGLALALSPVTSAAVTAAAPALPLPCLWAFSASISFSVFSNIRGAGMLICGLGGSFGWLVYLLAAPLGSEFARVFLAAAAISAYAEVMARLRKCPVTGYLLVAFFPLVPGGGIYYTMECAISGRTNAFIETGLRTLGVAGALAVGVLLVSSLVRMYVLFQGRPTIIR